MSLAKRQKKIDAHLKSKLSLDVGKYSSIIARVRIANPAFAEFRCRRVAYGARIDCTRLLAVSSPIPPGRCQMLSNPNRQARCLLSL